MNIEWIDGLPFVSVKVTHQGQTLTLDNILLDTGSGSTILPIDVLSTIGLLPEDHDQIHRVRGIGGVEYVFEKTLDRLEIDTLAINDFIIEIGQVDYGFNIQGILGVDFLVRTQAIIDFKQMILGNS